MKHCPQCVGSIQSAAIVCKHCGWNLMEEAPHNHPNTARKWKAFQDRRERIRKEKFRKEADRAREFRTIELEIEDLHRVLDMNELTPDGRVLIELKLTERTMALKLLNGQLSSAERTELEFRWQVAQEQIEKQKKKLGLGENG